VPNGIPCTVLISDTVEAACMITWVPRFLITLSGGYKNLHYLTQFIVTFYMYKKQQNLLKKKTYVVLPVVCLHLAVPE
jgi:hypothetical protein